MVSRPRKAAVREARSEYASSVVHYWDTSAIMPLLVPEPTSERLRALYGRNPLMVTWWATRVEVRSGLERRLREGSGHDVASAEGTLRSLSAVWHDVAPIEAIRVEAERLLTEHPLRAADALQLSAAIDASGGDPSTLPLVTLDRRLAAAAQWLGFPLPLRDLTER